VLNHGGGPPVSAQLRARVLAAVEELGYKPNGAARALASGRTQVVAWWAADCFTPFYAQLGRHVVQQGLRRHYHVMVNSWRHYDRDAFETLHKMSLQVDGLLVSDLNPAYGLMGSLYDVATPLVTMGAMHQDANYDCVGVDLYTGAVQAVEHLLRPGCRRVAYLCNAEATRERDPRTRAYLDVMQAAGYAPECLSLPDQQRLHARQAIVAYSAAHGLPEAIFCINDEVAIGCYRGLCDLGVRIPDDVALVGCDGLSDTEFMETPISTIVYLVEPMCQQAWDFLQRRIEEPCAPRQVATWPTQLVVRASSLR
jgi:LacI family transcriptional regulator